MAQTLVFGSIFVLIAATTDGVYAVAAGSLKPWLAKGRALGDFGHKLAGGIYSILPATGRATHFDRTN